MIGGHPASGASHAARAASTARNAGAPPQAARERRRADIVALVLVLAAAMLVWVPRHRGPIDLRWDAAVYYILGTSLAEGRGYKLLNEPGEIDAVQYPPLLPAIVAAHQIVLGTSDPTTVGRWLRLSSFVVFLAFAVACFRFFRDYLPPTPAALGSLLSVFCLHAWFLSDVLFPEVWFSVATLVFLIFAPRHGAANAAVAYGAAVASYALRTIGIAALGAWVLDSLLKRRFRQAALRTVAAAVPVLAWQGYVASVERSEAYATPAYAYQRAPYLFYNVTYARNIALRDPFTPEKGEVQILRRVARNALDLPVYLGGTLFASSGYLEMGLHGLFGDGPVIRPIVAWGVFLALAAFGALLVVGGAAVPWRQDRRLVTLYVLLYLAALCLTPFPGQYLRYLMPLAPLMTLLAVLFLNVMSRGSVVPGIATPAGRLTYIVMGTALLLKVVVLVAVFAREYQPLGYVDRKGEALSYRLFYYDDRQEGFERAIDFVRDRAGRSDVIAAGTPHWIHLRTGLQTVMPPFEHDAAKAQALLDSVPVSFLVVGQDVVESERYTRPVLERFPDLWERVYSSPVGSWEVYRRARPDGAGPAATSFRTPPPSAGTPPMPR